MPYILKEQRLLYQDHITMLSELFREVPIPEMSDTIASTFYQVLAVLYGPHKNYRVHNDVIGMLSCCSLEWQRRNSTEGFCIDSNIIFDSLEENIKFRVAYLVNDLHHVDKYQVSGHLNYIFTAILKNVFEPLMELNVFDSEEAVGILESVRDCWYTKEVGPYEDLKIKENGDV